MKRLLQRLGKLVVVAGLFGLALLFAKRFGSGGLWHGLEAPLAIARPGAAPPAYDLTRLAAVNETLETIRDKYVDPSRVVPRRMFLAAVDRVQREVAQVMVSHEPGSPTIKVRVETEEREFRVDNVHGHWDVAARLREVFAFLQQHLKGTEVDLRDVEYAACNGMLRTLDPHSVFLSPEAYRDMNLSTSGAFGGLGIVISVRDQLLTIMRPMPDTPAGRSGLRRFDRILKINSESTLNMPLDDAVKRLRGEPGTQVTIWIQRDGPEGWQGTRPFELTREEIKIRSVDSRSLAPGVGYVRLKQFQASTADELAAALDELEKKEKLKGLVLDLRGNPGGLLDQAARVADKFLDEGVIVATVGGSEGREEKRASKAGTAPNYPVVVLVDGSSASASEIVAGALKGQNRAVVVGQTTFGKGSVQLVFPRITPDGAALKLTIAQYLTPGDVSIQGVGVVPDVELDPMTADTLEMDLSRSEDSFVKERDLSRSLSSGGRRLTERPTYVLRYVMPESVRAELRELGGEVDDEFRLDLPIKFSRDLVQRLQPAERAEQLRQARAFVEEAQRAEDQTIAADLGRIGIDWSLPPAGAEGAVADDFEVTVRTDRKDATVAAGEGMQLEVAVKNKGTKPIWQLRAVTKSDGPYWDERELVFGKIGPGETKTATAPLGWCEIEGRKPGSTKPVAAGAKRTCRIPRSAVTRQDVVRVRFHAGGGAPPRDAEIRPTVTSLPRPAFAYSYQVVDDRPGNGDGILARGEGATVHLTVKNVGKGRSFDTQANLQNLTGDGILLHAGRFDVSDMAPGDVREVAFTFDVLAQLAESVVRLDLSVSDRDLGVVASEKVELAITRTGAFVQPASGKVRAGPAGASIRGQALLAAAEVARLAKGSVVERVGTLGEFTKVKLAGNRFAFVETRALEDAGAAPVSLALEPILARSPPLLEVSTGALSTREETMMVEATATDGDRVLDAFVFVGGRKVFYRSNRNGADPKRVTFQVPAKLRPGINVITVVARENDDTVSRYTRIIRRDGPNGEALTAPKGEELGEDWEFGGADE
ncbi:MAG: PDZ domain-containing protein [Polyangiaceae bacterium]|nr:PDZ domain-containing protein [Polyangiaceae bacterium]